jgi:hypothetical protein
MEKKILIHPHITISWNTNENAQEKYHKHNIKPNVKL